MHPNVHKNIFLQKAIKSAFEEDEGAGDFTTLSCIDKNSTGSAKLIVKQNGILAGMEVAQKIFHYKDSSLQFEHLMNDGSSMHYGDIAFIVKGHIRSILVCERIVLNCMQRMSGIATLTNAYVNAMKDFKSKLLDTRKTTPNFRIFEKEAVRIGGGHNHRFGLYDMILLKDNHIDFCGDVTNAVNKAHEYLQAHHLDLKIEVEVRNLNEVSEALKTNKVNRIMLDNFTPSKMKEAVEIINGQCETEASGNINLETIREYAATGVDFISSGAIIHQARSLDLSLKAVIEQ